MSKSLIQQLADLAERSSYDALPTEVQVSVKQRVLDSLGVSLAALRLDTSQHAIDWVHARGGVEQAHIIGDDRRVPATGAAFTNGVLAHSLDYDDTHLPSILHPSSSVVPAALAVGEQVSASGPQVAAAVAVGLEVCVRVGQAGYDARTNRNIYFDRGQHATSICGTLGAATAAAMLHGLDVEGIGNAIAVSCSMASGIIEANRGGGTVKRLHCGWAAQAGVSAAELVVHGFTGPPTALEGRFGLFQAFLGEGDEQAVSSGLGVHWLVPEIFFKPYPANHFSHTVVDAAAELARGGLTPEQIDGVTIHLPSAIVHTLGEPIEVKRKPQTAYQAQFSGPYAFTVGILGGHGLGAGLEDYSDTLAAEPRRQEIMAKVSVVGSDRLDAIYPMQFPAVIDVRLRDGSERTAEVLTNLGGPLRPLSDAQLAQKFRANAEGRIGAPAADALVEALGRLETIDDIGAVLALTTAPRG